MKLTDANRPLRVLDKVLHGGLGRGNIGVLMSRHGTGKLAVLTSMAIDHAMDGRNTLHVALNESVTDIRAYDDEVFHEIATSLSLEDPAEILAKVERHKQIYTYKNGSFNLERLAVTLKFLAERAEFVPEMIEIQGWPDFRTVATDDLEELKSIAVEYQCEIWCNAHTSREDVLDERGVPDYMFALEEFIAVLIALDPEKSHVNLRFIKTHGETPAAGIHLEFDPQTMLIRWR